MWMDTCQYARNHLRGYMPSELRFLWTTIHKFPQYEFLADKSTLEDKTWIAAIARKHEKMKKPTKEFMRKLEVMECLFNTYHGKNSLKPGINCFKKLSLEITKHIDLPKKWFIFLLNVGYVFEREYWIKKLQTNHEIWKQRWENLWNK